MSTPLALWPGLRVGRWAVESKAAPPRHQAAPADALLPVADGRWPRARAAWAFGLGPMYALPAWPWRAVAPLPRGVAPWLATMRAVGLLLLALLALTLAQVSPVFQAIVGKVLG